VKKIEEPPYKETIVAIGADR